MAANQAVDHVGPATENFGARMDEAIEQQAEITAMSAEANVELAKLNAIKKAFEKIQG